MDSAVREISSSAPAQALIDARVKPPNAIATPTIACRRVGPLVGAAKLFLLLIIVLPIPCFRLPPQKNTPRKYVQDNISLGRRTPIEAYFMTQRIRRPHALPRWSSGRRKEKHY